jgi:hypothetical protein
MASGLLIDGSEKLEKLTVGPAVDADAMDALAPRLEPPA